MAAYAATVVLAHRRPFRIGNSISMVRGTVDVTNYNQTLAEITAITKKFRDPTTVTVLLGGLTDNGYLVAWIPASKSIKAWYPNASHTHNLTVTKGAIGSNLELGLSADAAGATLNNNTIAVTLALTAPVVSAAAAAGTQVASDVDVGEVPFAAFGLS
jgi:hypothetical protein